MGEIQKPLEILVVEDDYKNANNAEIALRKAGHIPSFAFDLVGAMLKLAEKKPDVIFTDLCFGEQGIGESYINSEESWKKVNTNYSITTSRDYIDALNRSHKEGAWDYNPINSEEKIEELKNIMLDEKIVRKVAETVRDRKLDNLDGYKKEAENYAKGMPPMGFYIIEEAKKKNIPFIVITNPHHGGFFLPVLAKAGVEELDELLNTYHRIEKVEEYRNTPEILKKGNAIFSRGGFNEGNKTQETYLLALNLALKKLK